MRVKKGKFGTYTHPSSPSFFYYYKRAHNGEVLATMPSSCEASTTTKKWSSGNATGTSHFLFSSFLFSSLLSVIDFGVRALLLVSARLSTWWMMKLFFPTKWRRLTSLSAKSKLFPQKIRNQLTFLLEIEFSVALRLDLSVIVLHIVVHTVVEWWKGNSVPRWWTV